MGIILIAGGATRAGDVWVVPAESITCVVVVSTGLQDGNPLSTDARNSLRALPGPLGLPRGAAENLGIHLPGRHTDIEELWIGLRSLVEEGRQGMNDNRGWTPFGDVSDLDMGGGLVSAAVPFGWLN
jgi:hypothetical protein